MTTTFKLFLRDLGYLIIGSLCVAIAINLFFAKHSLCFGGVTGVCILAEEITGIPINVTNFALSLILLMWGGIKKGKEFVIKSLVVIVLISWVFIPVTQHLKGFPSHIVFAAFDGAISLGIGVGLILRAEASSCGPDLVAAIFKDKMPPEWTLRIIDSTILVIGIFIFGINNLYSIIIPIVTPFVVGKIVDTTWLTVFVSKLTARPRLLEA